MGCLSHFSNGTPDIELLMSLLDRAAYLVAHGWEERLRANVLVESLNLTLIGVGDRLNALEKG